LRACLAATRSGALRAAQKFKKYSGIVIKYFKLKIHRRTILMGSDSMNKSRFAITMYRMNPIR
jgi:hypothetical protein